MLNSSQTLNSNNIFNPSLDTLAVEVSRSSKKKIYFPRSSKRRRALKNNYFENYLWITKQKLNVLNNIVKNLHTKEKLLLSLTACNFAVAVWIMCL